MRLWAALTTDVALQARNQLYGISVGVSLVSAAILAAFSPPEYLSRTVPAILLMFAGGSTLLYVVGMLLLERADGTLSAISVSPLRPWEYLAAKVISLTGIALLEGILIVGGVYGWIYLSGQEAPAPTLLALVGMAALGALHVLVGVILVVRYRHITEALVPMSLVAVLLQVPALWFVGAMDHPAVLLIPSAGPTFLIRASFTPLTPFQWGLATFGTVLSGGVFMVWALRAFHRHVVEQAG